MATLTDKVAIVTGAGQGIGEGISLALAKEGAAIVAAGRTLSKVERTAAAIEGLGGRALAVECDVTKAEDVNRCVDEAMARFGRIDILVNNAQQYPRGTLLEVDDAGFYEAIDSGPLATFRFMRRCYPHLKASGAGVIINTGSSTQFLHEVGGWGVYAAAKDAILALTRTAAVEWGADGIRAIHILPAAETAMSLVRIQADPEEAARRVAKAPLRRRGQAEADIGRPVAWLCGPEASWITGTIIALNGGTVHIR